MIVAGSQDMAGAAVLAARGALAAGAGLVTVATTSLARHFVAPQVPEAMTVDLPDDDPATAFERIAEACTRADALLIGPGLGHGASQIDLVRRCVARLDLPTVLDADGLNAFRHDAAALADHAADVMVATPHRSELARVCGEAGETSAADAGGADAHADGATDAGRADDLWGRRIETVPALAARWRATIVAKGPGSLIAAPDGRVWIDAEGTAALATGGSGDVLAGMTVAALAAGTDVGAADVAPGGSRARSRAAAARVAATVTLHGLAGQAAAGRSHQRSVTASDIASAIPIALRRAERSRV